MKFCSHQEVFMFRGKHRVDSATDLATSSYGMRFACRCLLLYATATFAMTEASYAVPITIRQGMDSFTFQNSDRMRTAEDFQVDLLSAPPPAIGRGAAGQPFPRATFQIPVPAGGFRRAIYDRGILGNGVAPFGFYTHSFPGWPVGTMFDVHFSFSPSLEDPVIVNQGHFITEGFTSPTSVPEPSSLIIFGTGMILAMSIYARGRQGREDAKTRDQARVAK